MPSLNLSNPFRRGSDGPSLKERAAALKAGLARIGRRAGPEADQGRRTMMAASLAMVVPLPAIADRPTGLMLACEWAANHMAWINDPGDDDAHWSNERITAEVARFNAVLEQVADQPSQGIGDVSAKARLLLADLGCEISNPNAATHDRALYRLLKEVGALAPATQNTDGTFAKAML